MDNKVDLEISNAMTPPARGGVIRLITYRIRTMLTRRLKHAPIAGLMVLTLILTTGCAGLRTDPSLVRVTGDARGILVELPSESQLRRELRRDFNPRVVARGPFELVTKGGVLRRPTVQRDQAGHYLFFPMEDLLAAGLPACTVIYDRGNAFRSALHVRSDPGNPRHFAFPAVTAAANLREQLKQAEAGLRQLRMEQDKLNADMTAAQRVLADRQVFDGAKCITPPMEPLPQRPSYACSAPEQFQIAGAVCGRASNTHWPNCGVFDAYARQYRAFDAQAQLISGCRSNATSPAAVQMLGVVAETALAERSADDCKDIEQGSCALIRQMLEAQAAKLVLTRLPDCVEQVSRQCTIGEKTWSEESARIRAEPSRRQSACATAWELVRTSSARMTASKVQVAEAEAAAEVLRSRLQGITIAREDLAQNVCMPSSGGAR